MNILVDNERYDQEIRILKEKDTIRDKNKEYRRSK